MKTVQNLLKNTNIDVQMMGKNTEILDIFDKISFFQNVQRHRFCCLFFINLFHFYNDIKTSFFNHATKKTPIYGQSEQ